MIDLYICNLDTGEEIRNFKDVTNVVEGAISGSVLIETEKKNYIIKLRDSDFIEIYK